MSRPLSELKLRSERFPALASAQLIASCVEIARTRLPSPTFNMAQRAAQLADIPAWEAIQVGKAARWLAMIRREHGEAEFELQAKAVL